MGTVEQWREGALIEMWWAQDVISEAWLGDWYKPFGFDLDE